MYIVIELNRYKVTKKKKKMYSNIIKGHFFI